MAKKKIELNDEVEKLVEKYMTLTNKDLNEVVNKALKFYIVNQMTSNEVKDALQKADVETSKYIDHIFKDNINNDAYGNF
ncbi:hypothetical protein [Lactobacillus kalixensis]|nr:hypothetical protein [Lactobacillus kalixensis]